MQPNQNKMPFDGLQTHYITDTGVGTLTWMCGGMLFGLETERSSKEIFAVKPNGKCPLFQGPGL